ncbi:MAG: class I SAM-dependent methyltransferase [Blastocatellia bacterium]|nr:class I SAM-dependent methyltransferase [Blastocatellia bacterium]MCS7156275.1 class I SAM-dependent methyltransferase [Blastocatellia bacterium]MCX7751375.1 class I SAM-dependent methyltransferase [Blastocatellia bacterium]MDW8169087.1 class I SAM-dependent methyltransferase [Acidobacteriota bacterium]MDW8255792.1 class I SAM-dependent methyltransferase [Acidobacteriota bacterium]
MSRANVGDERSQQKRRTRAATCWRDADYLLMRALLADLRECRAWARGRLLDIGCGNQPYRELFAPMIQEYVGLDRNWQEHLPDVIGDALRLPFPAETFDTVLMLQVLEHLPDPSGAMSEVWRVLKRGGRVILTAPQYWRVHEEPHDYYRFTRFGLVHLAQQNGLRVLWMKAQGGAWTLAGQALANALSSRRGLHRLMPLANLFFRACERLWPDAGDPINHLLVAEK